MRTSNAITLSLIGLALGLSPAASFDGKSTTDGAIVGAAPLPSSVDPALGRSTPLAAVPTAPVTVNPRAGQSPFEALRSGTQALRDGRTEQGVTALEYAAGQGVPGAMWKLGRMYADGDGVDQNKLRAFEYFRNLTKTHAYDPPGTQQARFVASAFVALGHLYLEGIPNSEVRADPARAHEMYHYAASYYGDADAQYHLGRMYLAGTGVPRDVVQAGRWFTSAAKKGHRGAQAMLGSLLFKGDDGIGRRAGEGLAWLTIAKDGAGADEAWITETYSSALAQATIDERAMAHRYLELMMRNRRQ